MILAPLPPPPSISCPQTQPDGQATSWTNLKRNISRASYFCLHTTTQARDWFQMNPSMAPFNRSPLCASIEMGIFLDFLSYSYAVLPLQSRDRIGVMDQLFIFFESALLPSPSPPPPAAPKKSRPRYLQSTPSATPRGYFTGPRSTFLRSRAAGWKCAEEVEVDEEV